MGVKTEYALNDAKIHKLVKLITVQITLSLSFCRNNLQCSPLQPTRKREREYGTGKEADRQADRPNDRETETDRKGRRQSDRHSDIQTHSHEQADRQAHRERTKPY